MHVIYSDFIENISTNDHVYCGTFTKNFDNVLNDYPRADNKVCLAIIFKCQNWFSN